MPRISRNIAVYSSLGIEIAAAAAIGLWLGKKADLYFDSDPWGMIFGLLVGVAASLTHVVVLLGKDQNNN